MWLSSPDPIKWVLSCVMKALFQNDKPVPPASNKPVPPADRGCLHKHSSGLSTARIKILSRRKASFSEDTSCSQGE